MERNQNLCSRSTLPSFATLRTHHTRAKPPPVTGRLPPQASEQSHRNNSLLDFISHAIMQIIAREEKSPGLRRFFGVRNFQKSNTLQTASHGKASAFRQGDSSIQTLHCTVLPSLKLHSRRGATWHYAVVRMDFLLHARFSVILTRECFSKQIHAKASVCILVNDSRWLTVAYKITPRLCSLCAASSFKATAKW